IRRRTSPRRAHATGWNWTFCIVAAGWEAGRPSWRSMMKRVLCIWFPNWPVQCLRRARPELDRTPLILFHERPQGGHVVVHCSDEAARAGVRVGMSLAEADAMLEFADREHPPV